MLKSSHESALHLETQNYTIKCSQQADSLILRIELETGSGLKQYEASINDDNGWKKLQQLFDSKSNLAEYLKEAGHVQVNKDVTQLTILGKHPTKRLEFVKLITLQLNQIAVNQQQWSSNILKACNSQSALSETNLKAIIKQLTEKINAMYERADPHTEIQRCICKVGHLGEQIQSLNLKSVDLFSNFESLKISISKMQQKLSQTQSTYVQVKKIQSKLEQMSSSSDQQLANYEQKLLRLYETLQAEHAKILDLQQKLNEGGSKLSHLKEDKHIMKPMNEPAIEDASIFIDRTAKFSKHFRVKGACIWKQEDFIFPTILIGSISVRTIPEFTVRIKRMGIIQKLYPGVCVGIVDARHKDKQSCGDGDNVIEYSCRGQLFESNKPVSNQGKGFQPNDIVQVTLNFKEGVIQWYINKNLACEHKSKILLTEQIDWRPYIFMRDKGDSIDLMIN